VFLVVVAGGPRVADVLHGAVSPALGAGATTALGGGLVVVLTLVLARPGSAFVRYVAPRA
ncbi:MFS transporter, partial [Janibacter melonis]|nr:MFS transporter [Janibacter melonis]